MSDVKAVMSPEMRHRSPSWSRLDDLTTPETLTTPTGDPLVGLPFLLSSEDWAPEEVFHSRTTSRLSEYCTFVCLAHLTKTLDLKGELTMPKNHRLAE